VCHDVLSNITVLWVQGLVSISTVRRSGCSVLDTVHLKTWMHVSLCVCMCVCVYVCVSTHSHDMTHSYV